MDNYKIFIFLFPIFLISCALENNLTPLIRDDLRTSSAYSAYGIRPINLKIQSKCAQAPSVKIRNIEKNTHFYTVIKNQYYIVPSELMDVASTYLKEAYGKCRIEDDDNSEKIINISMINAEASFTIWGAKGATIEISAAIPEIGYSESYFAEDWTGKGQGAAFAYVIHDALWQIIKDLNVQDYILCREDVNYLKAKHDKAKTLAKIKNVTLKSVGDKIKVIAGTYGQNCGVSRGNKTEHLAKECNEKTKCEYVVNTFTIGDPYFGCAKNYIAEWQCGSDPAVKKSTIPAEAGWSSTVILTCE